jgi:hypothetical protein
MCNAWYCLVLCASKVVSQCCHQCDCNNNICVREQLEVWVGCVALSDSRVCSSIFVTATENSPDVYRELNFGKYLETSSCRYQQSRAVPWLRWLGSGLSPRRPGFASGSIYVGFVVDKVTLAQGFLRILRFSPVSIIPPPLSKLILRCECVIC